MTEMAEPLWPDDASTIRKWANGGTVSTEALVADLRATLDYFAPSGDDTATTCPDHGPGYEGIHGIGCGCPSGDDTAAAERCPTCGSEDPNRYYGSCFDNRHDTVFKPRLPMDPWHDTERSR